MHHTEHPLSTKTVIVRYGGKNTAGPICSVELIDWLDRLERQVRGRDSFRTEQMYLKRRGSGRLPTDDEIIIGMAQGETGPYLVAFHQSEILTFEGHPAFAAIIAEGETADQLQADAVGA